MTRKGVWNLQQVRDKYLQSLWEQTYTLWTGGRGQYGNLAQNNTTQYSSPVQVPGTTWNALAVGEYNNMLARKSNGTLWAWGRNTQGELGQNENGDDNDGYSSPVQIGSSTDWGTEIFTPSGWAAAIKTDGTLWAWGTNTGSGQLAQNNRTSYSSPVQIPGTTWSKGAVGPYRMLAIKTDGTLWSWGRGDYGQLGLNNPGPTRYSSPVQIPGTDWATVMCGGGDFSGATKTNGELWMWGKGDEGQLGQNTGDPTRISSPVQIPGTTWKQLACNESASAATKTDGTLWAWGNGGSGMLGQNATANYSSPIQIPGTTWDKVNSGGDCFTAVKTDGTLWGWGASDYGQLMQNNEVSYSSPIQIPGSWTLDNVSNSKNNDCFGAIKKALTPSQL